MTIPAIPGYLGPPTFPPQTARIVVPAGTDQATAAGVNYGLNLIDTAAEAGCLRLPAAYAGASIALVFCASDGGNPWLGSLLWAATGSDTINGEANNTTFDVANTITMFACVEDGAWLGNVQVD